MFYVPISLQRVCVRVRVCSASAHTDSQIKCIRAGMLLLQYFRLLEESIPAPGGGACVLHPGWPLPCAHIRTVCYIRGGAGGGTNILPRLTMNNKLSPFKASRLVFIIHSLIVRPKEKTTGKCKQSNTFHNNPGLHVLPPLITIPSVQQEAVTPSHARGRFKSRPAGSVPSVLKHLQPGVSLRGFLCSRVEVELEPLM